MQTPQRFHRIITLALLAFLFTACQPVRPTPAAAPEPAATPMLAPEMAAMAEAGIAFAAATLGVAPDTLRILTVEAVDWPDAALGCPQADMIYAAVITPGYRVVLETADGQVVVHTDSRLDGEKLICAEE